MPKLGIIVPYRNRRTHLNHFTTAIKNYFNNSKINYELIIVEQADKKSFNRGALLNIGVKKAQELECTYVALHDVDMLPEDVDYSDVRVPTHLATNFISENKEMKRIVFDEYFGGVTLFPINDYFHVNGYSNKYWGWGFEDDDLMLRCIENNIPGMDTGFTFNSYKRYKFETWTADKRCISLKSNISSPKQTILCASINQDEGKVKFYQDGELVDEAEYEGRILHYNNEKKIYLGNSPSLEHNKRRPFKGTIDYFALFNHSLESTQIKEISTNTGLGLTESYGAYVAPHTLEMCYDMRNSSLSTIIDTSHRKKIAEVKDCDRVFVNQVADFVEIPIPYRRESTFKLLYHKENGLLSDTKMDNYYFISVEL